MLKANMGAGGEKMARRTQEIPKACLRGHDKGKQLFSEPLSLLGGLKHMA
jgi:hypothetical protein